jgi:hypothetical protein
MDVLAQRSKLRDGKNFSTLCRPAIVTDITGFSDMKTGDDVVIGGPTRTCDGD